MTTIDDSLSEIRSVRNDIWRCRKLLQTDLPDAEREMIEKRLLEQRSAFEELLASTFPLALKLSSSSEETRLGLAVNFQEQTDNDSREANERRRFVRNARAWQAMPIEKTQAPPARSQVSMSPERDGLPSWIMPAERAQNCKTNQEE